MTREEALGMESIVRYELTATKHREAVDVAFDALRELEERSKGCEFCRWDNEGCFRMIGSFYLTNPYHKGEYYLNGGGRRSRKIEYCPMCGRKLEEEK